MNDLTGKITMQFGKEALEQLSRLYIAGYDPSRFQIVAIRLFCAKEIVLTIYAEDKMNSAGTLPEGKFPVKKFKKEIKSTEEFFRFVQAFNFTVSSGQYYMEDMEVTNK